MTNVTFTIDGLGPFDGDYKDEGKQLGAARRIEFVTPAGFPKEFGRGQVEVQHKNGETISGKVSKLTYVQNPGQSSLEFIRYDPMDGGPTSD